MEVMSIDEIHTPQLSSSPSPRVTVVNPVLYLCAKSFITLTASGIAMRCSDPQQYNAYAPISFSSSLIITIINRPRPLYDSSLIALADR